MIPTVQVDSNYLDSRAARLEQWKGIVRNDPRRAIRVLGLSGVNDETIEGDTALDSQYVLGHLKEIAKDAKSDAWKALVNAGLIATLCKCALNFQAALMHKHTVVDTKAAVNAARQMFAPYVIPLEIICFGLITGEIPPSPTDKKVIEELKKHWSSIMQRIWSEPAYSLEAEPKSVRLIERMVIPQMLHRLIVCDPSFLDVILSPNDLTLPVVFRYYLYATDLPDSRMNLGIVMPMLAPDVPPKHWKEYFDEHPPPPVNVRLARVLLGASKTAGSDKKKRTPGQTADAILSAISTHLLTFELKELRPDYDLFYILFDLSKADNPAFKRAVFKSSKFWTANAQILRRAGASSAGRAGEVMFIIALSTYTSLMHVVEEEGREFIDALVFNWVDTGLLDALEYSREMILKTQRGCMMLANVLLGIDKYLPQLSAKTRRALRAQFPRPWLTKRLLIPQITRSQEDRDRIERDYQAFEREGLRADPQSTIWTQSAWQMLTMLEGALAEPGECARRGCERQVADGKAKSVHACGMCKVAKYCSKACLESDKADHGQTCGWVGVLEPFKTKTAKDTDDARSQRLAVTATAASDSASNSSPPPPDISGLKLGELD